MCVPSINSDDSEATIGAAIGSFAWSNVMGVLASTGGGAEYLTHLLAGAEAATYNWAKPPKVTKVGLVFASDPKTVKEVDASILSPDLLASYGLKYDSWNGLSATEAGLGSPGKEGTAGSPQGQMWTLQDGALTAPPTGSVTGEVLGNTALEIPSGAVALARSASLLANHAFDDLVGPQAADDRLATGEKWLKGGYVDGYGVQWTTLHLVSERGDLIKTFGWPTADFPGNSKTTSDAMPGLGAAPNTSNSFANDLAEEHARSYSAGVAQADAAQQSEYGANQAAKDAASWARIDQNMSQSSAARASGGGQSSTVGAAPGYGPADAFGTGQAGPGTAAGTGGGTPPGNALASGQSGAGGGSGTTDGSSGAQGAGPGQQGEEAPPVYHPIIPHNKPQWRPEPEASDPGGQGLFKDGRWVPNVFASMTDDIWKGWKKSSGVEAVLTWPFAFAMAGALAIPQSINDIPNIPSMLVAALNDLDSGDYGRALKEGAAVVGAGGLASGIFEFVEALSSVDSAVSSIVEEAAVEGASVEGASTGVEPPRRGLAYGPGYAENPMPSAEAVAGLRGRCVPASGATVLRLNGVTNVTSKQIWAAAGRPADEDGMALDVLAETVNRLVPNADWEARLIFDTARDPAASGTVANLRALNDWHQDAPWIAGTTSGSEAHAIVIKSIDFENETIQILDPQPMMGQSVGTSYSMSFEAFFLDWDGSVVLTR